MRFSYRLLASVSSKAPKAVSPPKPLKLRKPPPLSLEHFIQQQRVLSLWRTILRNLFRIPKGNRNESIAYAKKEFERNKHVTDISQIRYLVSTGKTEFESMARYIDELAAR